MEDLSLRLLTNRLPLYADNIPIYSPLLINIADIGFEKYNGYLYKCTLGEDSLIEKPSEPVDDFDILLYLVINQEGALIDFLNALKFFTKLNFEIGQYGNDVLFFCVENLIDRCFYSEFTTINRHNYNKFSQIIKVANCMKNIEPEEEMDEFDREALKWEKKIAEKESEEGVHVPFKDLVSSVANMDDNGLNILNIWDINIFSFYEQMKRGQMKEKYFIGLKQLLAGAEAKDVDLEYYIQKTD